MSAEAGVRVASDVGGTFTDNVAYDEATGRITVAKVSTTPQNRAVGTVEGLRKALAQHGKRGEDVNYVGHGMTTATNAVIQRTGARTALVTNEGFRDLLLIGRQSRPSLYDLGVVRPEPLVPRDLCFTIPGRLDAQGKELVPLDRGALTSLAARLREAGVEAVAILFLHSYANPEHERLAKTVLSEALPGVVVCASTDVLAEFREFERGSIAVLNAFLMPIMEKYLSSLVGMLQSRDGLGISKGTPVMVMEASGGLMTVESARAKPIHTVLSGPVGGVVASSHIAAMSGMLDLITMDIGGTSTDISLIRAGEPAVTRDARLEDIPIRLPVIDINAIGAGGGSIAWIDDGGALRVGPRSAEAVPGPACYDRGGKLPTVTDAHVVLGRLDGKTRLGGELTLNVDRAMEAVEREVAHPLGMDVTRAAAGFLRIANANIVRGIRVVSVERGFDPREFALVPFGGAGPMHGSPVARELGMPRVLVPPTPGILCAFGLLVSDLRHDLFETHVARVNAAAFPAVEGIVRRMLAEAAELLHKDGVPPARQTLSVRADMRYVGQSYELPVVLSAPTLDAWQAVAPLFHEAHERRFGHCDRNAEVEVVGFAVTGLGRVDPPRLPELESGGEDAAHAKVGERSVFFEALDPRELGRLLSTGVYQRSLLRAGNVVRGPAVIDEVSATTVLYPGDQAVVDKTGSLLVQVST
jgi:N-methylhydantoinase A